MTRYTHPTDLTPDHIRSAAYERFATRAADNWQDIRGGIFTMFTGAVLVVGAMTAFSLGLLD